LEEIIVPVDLSRFVTPRHTAVLTMEVQRGVIGDLSTMSDLAKEATEANLIPTIARLVGEARSAGVSVVHCTASFRPDGASTPRNAPIITAMLRRPDHLVEGTRAVELVPELGPEPTDYISNRRHGLSPFGGTSLDATLRGLGVTTVIPTGVSLNIAIPGLAIEAVNYGYRVVLPTDSVCGVPADYGRLVLENTMAFVATLTTTDELIACWKKA
jgi:nicotinamidase-related amidase